ncbi:MarR family winged helix-turn-helix transcriptional regulator [Methylobacterium planeticum]|uniref:MarR family winged helix-turn-helix transcriptional regulator n=1 Tax=Methylobacterium planeticum TaxID=2615211 RepID=UPI001FEE62F0|nr:MarR family transcriptional regulator [Methylobacterium planeticum]
MRRELISQLMETARLLRYYVDRRARDRGMTRAEWLILLRLSEREGLSQVELADLLELRPISLVPLLDRLVRRDWVERRRGIADRRSNHLYLTEAGRAAVAGLDGLREDIARHVVGEPAPHDVRTALSLLRQMKERIKADEPDAALSALMAPDVPVPTEAG